MRPDTFSLLWDNAIVPAVKSVFSRIPQDVKDRYMMHCCVENKYMREKVFSLYDRNRGFVRNFLFNVGSGNNLMDMHKICACLVWAMVQVDLIRCDAVQSALSGKSPRAVLSAKYAAAIVASLHVLYALILSRKDDEAARIHSTGMLKIPATNKGHDPYLVGIVKSLAMCDRKWQGSYLDVPMWASMFFNLDRYNKEMLMCKHPADCGRVV